MDELIEFLTARLDEDAARHLGNHKCWWERNPFRSHWPDEDGPCRAIRDVEAKRAILAMWEKSNHDVNHAEGESRWYLMNEVVQALAAVYSDHADYRDEWRP